jgi:hypothetical protein
MLRIHRCTRIVVDEHDAVKPAVRRNAQGSDNCIDKPLAPMIRAMSISFEESHFLASPPQIASDEEHD